MNSTWLITSELANQRARKVLFTLVVYTKVPSSVVCSLAWPLNGSEAGGDLVLMQTSLLFFCVSEVVLMLTSWHLNEKAKRSVLKEGQLQLRLHSKSR